MRHLIHLFAGPFAAMLAAALVVPGCSKTEKPMADLIVTNARVWTVDPAHPDAEAIAIRGDRIVEVGTRAAVDAWRGPSTRTIDAGGRLVLPGFDDAHIHLLTGGMQLTNVDLKDAASPAEFARRIGERARSTPGEWILGGNWDEQAWTPAQLAHQADDRCRHTRHPGVRQPLRRTRGARQFSRPETGWRDGRDARIPPAAQSCATGRGTRPGC